MRARVWFRTSRSFSAEFKNANRHAVQLFGTLRIFDHRNRTCSESAVTDAVARETNVTGSRLSDNWRSISVMNHSTREEWLTTVCFGAPHGMLDSRIDRPPSCWAERLWTSPLSLVYLTKTPADRQNHSRFAPTNRTRSPRRGNSTEHFDSTDDD